MYKMKHRTILFFCLIILSSCDNFEKRLKQKKDEAYKNALENGTAYFDLSTITDFEWDSVLFFPGNRTVFTEYKEIIEEVLHGRESSIHWEHRRFGKKVDTSFRWHTTDLRAGRSRFFFLTPDKKIIEKEIKRQNGLFFEYCSKHDLLRKNWLHHFWLSKEEANFLLLSRVRVWEEDTVPVTVVWFMVNCIDDR